MNTVMRTPDQMKFTKDTCPDKGKHTPSPKGYVSWHAWAEQKIKTHNCHRCPTCGLWAIYKPNKRSHVTQGGGS